MTDNELLSPAGERALLNLYASFVARGVQVDVHMFEVLYRKELANAGIDTRRER
jgi:hypothetical protein